MGRRASGDRNKEQLTLQGICLAVLFVCLLITIGFFGKQYMGLNVSVEYERTVFVSQIAEQMKNNMVTSRSNYLELTRDMGEVLAEVLPESFEEVRRIFPEYAKADSVNHLFFLSSDCELFGIDGAKQWASLPDEGYLLEVASEPFTTDFIRIGMNQEFMIYSTRLPSPVTIDGNEIAAIMYAWDSSQYREVLSSTMFEKNSSSLLVGTNGNIAIYPEDGDHQSYGYNALSYLKNLGISDKDLENVKDMIAGSKSSTYLCDVGGGRWLFSVTKYSDAYRILIMLPIEATSSGTYHHLYGMLVSVCASLVILFMAVGVMLLSVYQRRRAQREKELQTELLMQTAQVKNEFLAKMSHDIRTPLNGIIGMNYIAASKTPPENAEVADCLRKVDSSAKYLLGILNDILDMSKIESGEVHLAAAAFSLKEMTESMEPIMAAQTEGKDIEYAADLSGCARYYYIGDELRIKQILMNLLSNAAKFTEQGTVTLTIRSRMLTEDKDEVIFVVKDTGKGMTEEFLENIFTPFTQEDSGIASRYGGSGLGLAITKSYVDLMGGTISVTSSPGKGSKFTVSVPLMWTKECPAEEPELQSAKLSADFHGKRVLLCEDNELNAEIATAILEDFKLQVDWAENGKVGTDKFLQAAPGTYAMIFMDVRMPEMDGYEATRIIRGSERPDGGTIPICALSANAFTEDIKKSMESGMNEHLAKPVEVERLSKVLEKYLN